MCVYIYYFGENMYSINTQEVISPLTIEIFKCLFLKQDDMISKRRAELIAEREKKKKGEVSKYDFC